MISLALDRRSMGRVTQAPECLVSGRITPGAESGRSVREITASLRPQGPEALCDYPGESFFDVFVEVTTPSGMVLRNVDPLRWLAIIRRWPPHGELYLPPPEAVPAQLYDESGVVMQIVDWRFGAFGQGDCNADRRVDAGDISMEVLEIFDGDGMRQPFVTGGFAPGKPIGCDSNGDAGVDAGDLSCTILRIFGGPGACGEP